MFLNVRVETTSVADSVATLRTTASAAIDGLDGLHHPAIFCTGVSPWTTPMPPLFLASSSTIGLFLKNQEGMRREHGVELCSVARRHRAIVCWHGVR